MEYREYGAPPPLAAIVQCLWILESSPGETGQDVQPVLPDGRPELVLHLGDPFDRLHPDGSVERQPCVLFAGQLTAQLLLRPTGRVRVVGVRLRPDGASALIREPQRNLTDTTIDVGDVCPGLAATLNRIVEDTDRPEDGVKRIGAALAEAAFSRPDPRVRYVVDEIDRRYGCVGIGALAARAGLTLRHLERRFLEVVGVSPKRLARIARFQRALAMLERLDGARGAHTASSCGYADQAHFVREFRRLAGCTPGTHLMRRAEMTALFTGRGEYD